MSTPITTPTSPAAGYAPAAPTLRAATPADLPAVERLLAAADLPTAGVAGVFADRADDFVVADDPHAPGELAAVAGLEVCCDNALLRSVAVRPDWGARAASGTRSSGASSAGRRSADCAPSTCSR